MKLWGLVRMLTHTACATQQNSLIGPIPKIDFFVGQDNVIDISVPI